MRGTSKASSAGLTQRQATGLGRISRGALASRGGSLGADGSSAPSPCRRSLSILAALFAVACLIPGSALAAKTRQQVESFGSDGTSGTTFASANAVAFDQGSKHLYVLDQAEFSPGSVYGFDDSTPATHTPLGGNFPVGVPSGGEIPDLAVDSASHDFYYLSEEEALLYRFDSAGNELGGAFPLGGFSLPCGAAVDPSGNVWVGDYLTETVTEHNTAGTLLETVDVSGQGTPCQVALDSESNLYISFYEGAVWKYTAESGYNAASEVDPAEGSIAVDRSSDDLYVAHPDRVAVYDSSGNLLYEFGAGVSGATYSGIAIDQGSDLVYVADAGNGVVQVFGPPIPLPTVLTEDPSAVAATTATLHGTVNPEGDQLTDCHFEYGTTTSYGKSAPCVPAAASIPADSNPHAVSANISGLNPNTTYHVRLVAATAEGTANGPDLLFTTAIGPPTVSAQSVEAVGTADATVTAKVNPKGAKTTYHVEYGPTAAYGQSTPESAPIGFGGDDSDHTVSAHVGGLEVGTAYHFRFVATSPAGSAQGTDTTFATYPTTPSFPSCPNDQFRTGFGARLPDCRAYEQATPTEKHGANVQGPLNTIQASSAGDRIDFYVNAGLPTTGGSSRLAPYMASRGAVGWSSDGLLLLTDPGFTAEVVGWSDDLSTAVGVAPGPGNVGRAIYLRDSDTAAFQLGPSIGPFEVFPAGFAADASNLIFESRNVVLPDAVAEKTNLYELDHGVLSLVGRIPAGAATSCDDDAGPACVPAPEGAMAGPYAWDSTFKPLTRGGASARYYTQNTISRDGSRVFFTALGNGRLYMREDGTKTTWVSASQRTVPDPNGHKPAAFMAATPDGSKVFFTSCEKLTDDSTAVSTAENRCVPDDIAPNENQGQDLYSYDVDTGQLTDLSVDSNVGDAKGAAVIGVLGASEDGAYAYFVANGVLAEGASTGDCRINGGGHTCNLYVSHNGTTTFIASLRDRSGGEVGDANDWLPQQDRSPGSRQKTARVSADGSALLFSSERSLTGYDNIGPCAEDSSGNPIPGPCQELFRHSAPDEELTCVSCNPTRVPPRGKAALGTERNRVFSLSAPKSTFLTRNLSADGKRVFFDSPDALLPTDTNGVIDVYEWEAKGSGSCESESQNGGCIYLISSGTSPDRSLFADASSDGDHVFLFTSQQLVPGDHDELLDIYDAGIGAGLASQHTLAPPTCSSTACQANPAPPPDQPTASAFFSGPGNAHKPPSARKCPKGKRQVRRAGKVRCQKAHKQNKRHNNRGGSK